MNPACSIILFGATGDLTRKKLIPALYKLHMEKKLHVKTRIICIGRRQWSTDDMIDKFEKHISDGTKWSSFRKRLQYHELEFHDLSAYKSLGKKLDKGLKALRENRLFYLATPPSAFPLIVENLKKTKLAVKNPKDGWHRVVFEKPFGTDSSSAKNLNNAIGKIFTENQIYRIDHYVGKSFVQEIMVLRFANPMFEFLWHKDAIDNIQIVVAEAEGIGSRGGYYENSGAMRDMIQNHLLQILALAAMEPPKNLKPETIREAKATVLKKIKVPKKQDVVLGQYTFGNGIKSYRKEEDVDPKSETETFANVKLMINNKRWRGVPFYLRTGKALKHRYAEVAVVFKKGHWFKFKTPDGFVDQNVLVIRIQPDEGLKIRFNLSHHQYPMKVSQHLMDFSHSGDLGINTPEAYEFLLEDVMIGDQTLFTRWDIVQQSWKIIDALKKCNSELHFYKAGSHGPDAALALMEQENQEYIGREILNPHRKDHISGHQ